jgi:hypothetical protein
MASSILMTSPFLRDDVKKTKQGTHSIIKSFHISVKNNTNNPAGCPRTGF